jgi:L-iditol 2-dehydrogenase
VATLAPASWRRPEPSPRRSSPRDSSAPDELPTNRLVWGDIALIGSLSYSTSEWTRVVGLLERRLVDLDPIVTHRFPARRFEDAFALMEDRDGVVAKVLLEHPA